MFARCPLQLFRGDDDIGTRSRGTSKTTTPPLAISQSVFGTCCCHRSLTHKSEDSGTNHSRSFKQQPRHTCNSQSPAGVSSPSNLRRRLITTNSIVYHDSSNLLPSLKPAARTLSHQLGHSRRQANLSYERSAIARLNCAAAESINRDSLSAPTVMRTASETESNMCSRPHRVLPTVSATESIEPRSRAAALPCTRYNLLLLLYFAMLSTLLLKPAEVEASSIICNPNSQVYDSTLSKCCTICRAGYGVVLPCTPENDTECVACPSNHFKAVASHQSCELCANCPRHSHVVHRCNATHNTKCECDEGLFYDGETKQCKKCTQCKLGEGVHRQCNPNYDTRCEACPANSYSIVYKGIAACFPCSKCRSDQTIFKMCTTTEDTVCSNKDGSLTRRNTSGKGGDADSSDGSQSHLTPIFCGLLGCLIAILLVYALFKRWNIWPFRKTNHAPKLQQMKNSVYRAGTHDLSAKNRKPTNFSAPSKQLQPILVTKDTLVQDLPDGLKREVELRLGSLDDTKNWVALALHLDYPLSRVRQFESQTVSSVSPSKTAATSSTVRIGAARLLLNDWCKNPNSKSKATLEALIFALDAIRRQDISQMLIDATSSRSIWTKSEMV